MSKAKCPDVSWSLERLGSFCNSRRKRLAEDAWWIGRAIQIAKAQTKHGEFTAWKRRYGFSDAVASRYLRLCAKHKSPNEIKGQAVTKVLVDDGILPAPKDKMVKDAAVQSQDGTLQSDGSYSWEAGKPDETMKEASEGSGGRLTIKVSTEEFQSQSCLGGLFVEQMRDFRSSVERVLEFEHEQRVELWPPELIAAVKAGVVELQDRLSAIERCLLMVEEVVSATVAA